jgi:hypothetical protein
MKLAKEWNQLDQVLDPEELADLDDGEAVVEMIKKWGVDTGNFDILKRISPAAESESTESVFIKPIHKLPLKSKAKVSDESLTPENLTMMKEALQEKLDTRSLFFRSAASALSSAATDLNPLQTHLEQLSLTVARKRFYAEQEKLNEIGKGGESAMKRGTVRNWLTKWTLALEKVFVEGKAIVASEEGEEVEPEVEVKVKKKRGRPRKNILVEEEAPPVAIGPVGALERLRRQEFGTPDNVQGRF